MKKNRCRDGVWPFFYQILRKMKLTLMLLFLTVLTSIAADSYSQSVKLTLKLENTRIEDVLGRIEDKSKFRFFYNEEIDLEKKISLNASDESIVNILDEIFRDKGIHYEIIDRQIILSKDANNSTSVFQQQKTISGKVTDNLGVGLPGVSVVLKGTTTGVISDMDGKYTIAKVPANAILQFSFVGMKTQEFVVSGKEIVNVKMEEETVGIDEVVAIGYGTVKKSDLTGSVASVKVSDFKTLPTMQVSDMLTGTVAGFYAKQSASAAGGSSMEVRGPTSLSAGTTPLIVLDGVIFNGNISEINPNDIEKIDILKDASSAAIYGSKAASGVVILTTLKGKKGKPTINFSTKIGMSEAASDYRPLDGEEYLKFRGEYLRSLSNYTLPKNYFTRPDRLPDDVSIDSWRSYSSSPNSDNTIEYLNRHKLQTTEVEQYLAGKSVDWYDMVVVPGLRQDYDLSISGGTDNITYYWSLGAVDNEGIIKGDAYSSIRSRINLDFKINNWLNVGINAQYADQDQSAVKASLSRVYRVSPWSKPNNDDGTINLRPMGLVTAEHPLMEYYGTDSYRKANSFFSSIFAQLTLPYGITYKLSYQPSNSWTKNYKFYGDQSTVGIADHVGGYGTRGEYSTFKWMVDNLLKWNKKFGIHNFDVTLLQSAEQNRGWNTDITNETFSPNLYLGYHALQFGIKPSITNDDYEATGDALMGRLNYTMADKYFLTASIRRDGYSAFGQKNPRAVFPAVALAWLISEEGFFQSEFINRMKLRLSWGVNGNRDIGMYSALANLSDNKWYDGSKVMIGVYNSTLANSELRWERTQSLNTGLDIGLFKSKIDLSVDYYDMSTTDLLMSRVLPRLTGFQNIMSNLGELGNRGFEMTLNTVNISKPNLIWRSNLVFSLNRNKIRKLFGDMGTYTLLGEERSGELPDFSNQWFPGQPIDVVWNYKILGIWQEDEAAEAAKYLLKPGDYKAEDANGDYKYVNTDDKKFIGYDKPRYRIGLRNEFSFLKNFTASLFVRADLGHIGAFSSATQSSSEFDRFSMSGMPVPYWTPENPTNDYARLDFVSVRRSVFGGGLNIYKPMSFVRIQDFSISYSLPNTLIQKWDIKNMKIFSSVRNLYCFSKWPGFDPESSQTPMPRTYTIGIDITL